MNKKTYIITEILGSPSVCGLKTEDGQQHSFKIEIRGFTTDPDNFDASEIIEDVHHTIQSRKGEVQ